RDLDYFKAMTRDRAVLMGKQTYRSLKDYYKDRALPFKKSYVATSARGATYPDATVVRDLEHFLETTDEDIMVIGGRSIYAIALPYAFRLYITYILAAYEGDVYFPDFSLADFRLVNKVIEERLIFAVYERISP
ncbi:MAG: dihydrofolate reductase, partial [Acholeplasmataceae bacterium]